MEMRSGPKVSGRSRRVAADQGWSLRGVPLYLVTTLGQDLGQDLAKLIAATHGLNRTPLHGLRAVSGHR